MPRCKKVRTIKGTSARFRALALTVVACRVMKGAGRAACCLSGFGFVRSRRADFARRHCGPCRRRGGRIYSFCDQWRARASAAPGSQYEWSTTPNPATTQPPPAAAPAAPTQTQPPPQTQIHTPPAVPVVAATAQTTPQDELRPTRWPNALMRGRKVITPLPPPAVAPAHGEADEEKSAQTDHKSSGGAAASATMMSTHPKSHKGSTDLRPNLV